MFFLRFFFKVFFFNEHRLCGLEEWMLSHRRERDKDNYHLRVLLLKVCAFGEF